ncbi:hypothetical protein Lesp02_29790 [Lentzea sp. NBRC 105346]|uniref:helix-turn-helix domain-containing protein n=1 Tax=Lentzea sp. NBRC 105346 TaxID=3032205 RepID=UPI0024A006E3|nr:helix-turn-helix transcriptional regulator [Lentzea sp. NBRC 105346]GLZ30790.1 hypothetical protein Lesp02_29790 [Lentzea sp. NBRC 105346]
MSEDHSIALGEYLRAARETAKLSGEELARRMGITGGYLNRLERGERSKPTPEMMQRFVDELGLDPAEAFAFIGVKPAAVMPTRRAFFRSTYGVSDAEADEIISRIEQYIKAKDKEGANGNNNQESGQ